MTTTGVRVLITSTILGILLQASALGYVIFLKDGTQIVTKETFRVEGENAVFERENGVTASIALSEVDVERTRQENRVRLSGAKTIDGFDKVDLANAPPPPPSRDSLSDLLRKRGEAGGVSLPQPRKRPNARADADAQRANSQVSGSEPGGGAQAPAVPRTSAGFADLLRLPRKPFSDIAARSALNDLFVDRGLEVVGIHEGTESAQPFIELIAATESEVFEALSAIAGVLLEARTSLTDSVEAFELLILTRVGSENRGGQFQLTPELAELLVGGELAPPAFFLRYVEF